MQLTNKIKEWLIIGVAWMILYVASPLYIYYATLSLGTEFDWNQLFSMWRYMTLFLVVFLVNHFFLVPRLVVQKRLFLYAVSIVSIIVAFAIILRMMAPFEHLHADMPLPPTVDTADPGLKPFLFAPPDLARLVILILMLGVDLGVVAWFNGQRIRNRLLLLEQQNLKQELEQLRYQINPHFFMNTLNNIHVLIDIDQERAKRAIVELSSMMRYSLYEGNGSMVPLTQELDFLRHYISLMRLRYNNKVEVSYNLPESLPTDIQILPLLLPTFVENAFKHGISYREHSFVHVSLSVNPENEQIQFCCVNSHHDNSFNEKDEHRGIGLENVRKRLELCYGDSHQLRIDRRNKSQYSVELLLPSKP